MDSLAVVEDFDVVEDSAARLVARREPTVEDQLLLEVGPERFDDGVVPALAFAAYAGRDGVGLEDAAELVARVLGAAVAVE